MGSKRTIYHGSCKECNGAFSGTNKHQEYCSKVCYYEMVRKLRVVDTCAVCGTEMCIHVSQHSRNDKNYCSRECYNNRADQAIKKIKRHTQFYSEMIHSSTCECGESRDYLLEIHHKDGNNRNNALTNLEVVCSNCHMLRHLKKNKKGRWVYHPKSLTDRSLLNSL